MMKTRLMVVVAALLCAACGEAPTTTPQEVARPVKIHTFTGTGGELTLSYSGTVSAAQRSEMGFEVPGRITELLVSAGEAVSEGQVLARVDPTDYQAALDSARAEAEEAEIELERYQRAFEGAAVTRQELDGRRRNAEVARAALEVAEKGLADTELRAIFDGEIAQIIVGDFANVQAKQPVLVLQDDSSLELEITVPEQDWVRARPDLDMAERTALARPRVELPALPDRGFPARFSEADTAADPVTRTYAATFAFDRPGDVTINPGMTGRIVLTIPQELSELQSDDLGATIPAVAVAADEAGAAFVWVVGDDMSVVRRSVTVGEITGESVVLIDGLSPGERIATSGVHNLREGMTVREFGG